MELKWQNVTREVYGADWLELKDQPGMVQELIRVDGPGEHSDTCTVQMIHSDEIVCPPPGITYFPGPTPKTVKLKFYHPIEGFILLPLIGRKRG